MLILTQTKLNWAHDCICNADFAEFGAYYLVFNDILTDTHGLKAWHSGMYGKLSHIYRGRAAKGYTVVKLDQHIQHMVVARCELGLGPSCSTVYAGRLSCSRRSSGPLRRSLEHPITLGPIDYVRL
jgi:hypothetical protein